MLKSGRNHKNQNKWGRSSWQRLLALLCAFVLMVSGTPMGTAAAEGETAAKETTSEGTETVSGAEVTPKARVRRMPSGSAYNYDGCEAIYLNGSDDKANDGNDGKSADTPFKTFEKAREIAEANPSIKTIYVTGTVDVSGDISLAGTNAVMRRDPSFKGYLMEVTNTVSENTLKNITIDGNSSANVKAEKSLINVTGSLKIGEETVLQCNKASVDEKKSNAYGGALHIAGEDANVEMTGGIIKKIRPCGAVESMYQKEQPLLSVGEESMRILFLKAMNMQQAAE